MDQLKRKNNKNNFDVIVVGAGHAGVEAALSTSRSGLSTLLLTSNIKRISYMSCNPSIGGLAKGHMVREIDFLGGEMGRAADETCIQFKRLNSSKGAAVRGSRTQNDKSLYSDYMSKAVFSQKNLIVKEAEVKRIIIEGNRCKGVVLIDGSEIFSSAAIVTTGTFMNGTLHVGFKKTSGGRHGDFSTQGLSDQLRELGFSVKRLKTGTPARLHKDSIDWAKTVVQKGDPDFFPFSFRSKKQFYLPQIDCYLTKTTEQTHEIIRKNLNKSPMYCGIIEGTGPRYCPSIEDKVVRFAHRDSHQTFLEPEGLKTSLVYLQGISTSLPEEVQEQFIRTISGLEKVQIIRYGYAVEYDFVEPDEIDHTLETKKISNLYLAGQINGTSGYEEAAAQGFVAGINTVNKLINRDPFILSRQEAYIGVLIDDLVTKGTKEPYRMFTSRAEHRLVIREDNTLDRMIKHSSKIGILTEECIQNMYKMSEKRKEYHSLLKEKRLFPNAETNSKLKGLGTSDLMKPISFEEFLRRPEISYKEIYSLCNDLQNDPIVCEPVEIEIKYSGYIRRHEELIKQIQQLEDWVLPNQIEYEKIKGLSREEVEKLNKFRPRTLGQAQKISGVNPSAIQSIVIHTKR